jgi:hypothetical protein
MDESCYFPLILHSFISIINRDKYLKENIDKNNLPIYNISVFNFK